MGNRRMLSRNVTEKSTFLKMPLSTQALYFHLNLNADDDGVVEAFKVIRMINSNEDDLRVLATRGFIRVLNEDELVCYISDWNENNLLRADRKKDSRYLQLLVQVVPDAKILAPTERADRKEKRSGTSQRQRRDSVSKVKLSKDNIYIDQKFEEFWKLYPRKVNKAKALQVFTKLEKEIPIILEKLKVYPFSKEIAYVPHATTWLNGRRWEDETTTSTAPKIDLKYYENFR